MFTDTNITLENLEKIVVTVRGNGGFAFFWVSFCIRGLDMDYMGEFFFALDCHRYYRFLRPCYTFPFCSTQ